MPVQPTYPGVYIEEIPSGVHTIVGVATSITAFIGRALRGPTDADRPVTIHSYADYERIFGGLWLESTMSYAVRDFFLNGGSQAVIVRLYQQDGDKPAKTKLAVAGLTLEAAYEGSWGNSLRAFIDTDVSSDVVDATKVLFPDVQQSDFFNLTVQEVLVTGKDKHKRERILQTERFPNLTLLNSSRRIDKVLEDESRLVRWDSDKPLSDQNTLNAAAAGRKPLLGMQNQLMIAQRSIVVAQTKLDDAQKNPEAYQQKLADAQKSLDDARKQFTEAQGELADPQKKLDDARKQFTEAQGKLADPQKKLDDARKQLTKAQGKLDDAKNANPQVPGDIQDAQKGVDEAQKKVDDAQKAVDDAQKAVSDAQQKVDDAQKAVSDAQQKVDDAQKEVTAAQNNLDDLQSGTPEGVKNAQAVVVTAKKELAAALGPDGTANPSALTVAYDGLSLTEQNFLPEDGELQKTGLFALEHVDLFNILCISPYLPDGNVDVGVVSAAAKYCEDRRAMLLVDPPSNWVDKETAKDKFTDAANDYVGTRSKNAAIFFPRLKQPNPLRNNQVEEFVPCGTVAGIFARTDAQRGVWKAPAGLDAGLVGVPQLSVNLTDAENGELNQLGINCLRSFPIYGRVVWGARTLRGADQFTDEYKYLPVRRLALFIEESLYRGTKWVVFEPNDEPLWAQIRLNVGAFMHNLFRQRAFQGMTPREAYFVKCDKETTTQNDINLGIVNILVGFAPLKPAEFVIIQLQQMAGQIQV